MTADPLLKRLEWNALVWCLAVTALAWFATNSRALALGVLGGGVLSGVSILAIRTSVETLLSLLPPSGATTATGAPAHSGAAAAASDGQVSSDAQAFSNAQAAAAAAPDSESAQEAKPSETAGSGRPATSRAVIKLVGRYALLGLMAYAMIARLRLHPIGLLIGASSLVASASFEAFRVVTRPRRV